jgi:hypothetical protein
MQLALPLLLTSTFAALGQNASAGGPTTLLRVGDVITGFGTVASLASRVAVDDAGNWWVQANSGATSAIISNGQVVVRTGTTVTNPSGATITAIRSFGVSRGGTAVWTLALSTGATGVYRGTTLSMLTGTAVVAGGGFPSGSTYTTFRHAQPNGTSAFMLLGTATSTTGVPSYFVSVVSLNGSG